MIGRGAFPRDPRVLCGDATTDTERVPTTMPLHLNLSLLVGLKVLGLPRKKMRLQQSGSTRSSPAVQAILQKMAARGWARRSCLAARLASADGLLGPLYSKALTRSDRNAKEHKSRQLQRSAQSLSDNPPSPD